VVSLAVVRCPSCQHENPADSRFCNRCGSALVAPRRTGSAHEYTPSHLRDRILKSRSALEGERKLVTVLFADVKGSTALAETVDPEEWHDLLDRFFQVLTQGVHRHEGTVNQYTGDGIMALFGAPIAHEDHARRACHAALELRDELRRFADQIRIERGLAFAVRIGVHTGEVIVGKIGDDLRMDYTAQGATVNLAARMEQLAAPGHVYASERTMRLVRGYFRFRDLGPTRVKGIDGDVRVYELESIGSLRSRFDASRAKGLSTLVGREEEMAQLEDAIDRLASGEGGVLRIVGEPGIGKSRLCHEIAERARQRRIRVTHAACPPHGRSVPLMVAMDFLRSYFGLVVGESEEAARDKVAGRLSRLAPERLDVAPLLFQFLGIPDQRHPAPRVAPEAVLARLTDAVTALQRARGPGEPMVLLVEDVQWADPASEDFLGALIDQAGATNCLAVVNYRTEYQGLLRGGGGEAAGRELALAPLSAGSSDQLLEHLLGPAACDAAFVERIRERAAGNPFFVEEVVQALAESGSLVGSPGSYVLATAVDRIVLPETVHDLLAARIDRLGEREKAVLQTAAVVGKTFELALLESIANLPSAELDVALEALDRAGLLQPETPSAHVHWGFKHPLTQEVAYGSLLSDRRKGLHAAVAAAVQQERVERLDESAALIAYHLESAGDLAAAVGWLRRAAVWVQGRDFPDALRHWRRIRELTQVLGDSPSMLPLRREACGSMLRIGLRLGLPLEERRVLLGELAELHARLGSGTAAEGALLVAMPAAIEIMEGGSEESLRALLDAHRRALASGDLAVLTAVSALLAVAQFYAGRLEECLATTEGIVSAKLEDPQVGSGIFGTNPYLLLLMMRSSALRETGRLAEALAVAERGAQLGRELDDPEHLVMLLIGQVDCRLERGEPDGVAELASEALRAAERLGSVFSLSMAMRSVGLAEASAGRWEAARDAHEKSLALLRQSNFGVPDEAFRIGLLAEALAHCGEQERALALVDEAIALARKRGVRLALVTTLRMRASILLLTKDRSRAPEVEALAREATAAAHRIGARTAEALSLFEHAGAAWLAGDRVRCEAILREAAVAFHGIGATGQEARVQTILAGAPFTHARP
jgi:class 3 adenylate cyclase/tetratricopeptide (TPR) repeat protein